MNCQDVNELLDRGASTDPRVAQGEAIRLHLATCAACRETWSLAREVARLPVPVTPARLRARIEALVPAQKSSRPGFQPYLIGGLIAAGVAFAAAVALQARGDAPAIRADWNDYAATASDGTQNGFAAAVTADASAIDETEMANTSAPASASAERVATSATDPFTLLVLRRPEPGVDGSLLAELDRCHEAMVRILRTVDGLRVNVDPAVLTEQPAAAPGMLPDRERALAMKQRARHVLVLSSAHGCRAAVFDLQQRFQVEGFSAGAARDDWTGFAEAMARNLSERILMSSDTRLAQTKATARDTSLAETARVVALSNLLQQTRTADGSAVRAAFDPQVVAAAVQLATTSRDKDIRAAAWSTIRDVDDLQALPPLLRALAADPDKSVRYQAALGLHGFLDQQGVREALLRAAAQDADAVPEAPCCILTVREAAERAAVPDAELKSWIVTRLHDESLPARSRLISLGNHSPDGRIATFNLDADALRVVFDIGRNERDARVRRMAWEALARRTPDETFAPVLLADLSGHADEYVRHAAAEVLKRQATNPEVRKAFEKAVNDPSMAVRRVALEVLQAPVR